MGEKVKIRDMEEKMIMIEGIKVRKEEKKKGDIEIEVKGIREGEKMYEEIL